MFNFIFFKLSKTCKQKGFSSVRESTKKTPLIYVVGFFNYRGYLRKDNSLSLLRLFHLDFQE